MSFQNLDNKTLMQQTKESVRIEKQSTLVVLEYLAEVDRRRLWMEEGYSSLHDFCVRYLNYSESEAARRIQGARCIVRVPEAKAVLEENRISLSGLSLIAPHLTRANASEMLPMVEKHSTREITQVLAQHFNVPAPLETLNLPLDGELLELLEAVSKKYGQKDRLALVKRALKEVVSKPTRRVLRPVKHTRNISAAIRRQVKSADGHRCSFKGPSGVECNQTGNLQIDHIRPWAKGGSSQDLKNLRVLCRAHNLMLGKRDFPNWERPLAREAARGI